jgi:hypothetical protein
MTDPLSMLDVIEESRQRAMEQRENAVQLLAAFALKAIIEGENVRDVAERGSGLESPGASVHSGVERSASPSGGAPPESIFEIPSAYDPWEG